MSEGRSVADPMKQHRHDPEVWQFARDFSAEVGVPRIGGHWSGSLTGDKTRRLSFKHTGASVARQMLPDGMKALAPLSRRRVGLTVKEYPMATLTYFTCKLHYMSVVRHEFDDADADPEVKGIKAGVTITAFIQQPPPKGRRPESRRDPGRNPGAGHRDGDAGSGGLPTGQRDPDAARGSGSGSGTGRGHLRQPVQLPATGLTTKLYRRLDTGKV